MLCYALKKTKKRLNKTQTQRRSADGELL